MELVVAGQCQQDTKSWSQREEHLCCCIYPYLQRDVITSPANQMTSIDNSSVKGQGYLRYEQLLPLGCDKVHDTINGTRQCETPDEQDDKDDIRGCSSHPDSL